MKVGDRHYRAYIGDESYYDQMAAVQFNLMTSLGLRGHHRLLDIGCGSLRAGKLFIPYLLPERYFGIDQQWLIDEGVLHELGQDMVDIKQPRFDYNMQFRLTAFHRQFDYIIAQSIFSHATAVQIRTCLAQAAKVMKPTAIFAATFLAGKLNYNGEEWAYPGIVSYNPVFMAELVEEAGLVYEPLDFPHPEGQRWFAIVKPGLDFKGLL